MRYIDVKWLHQRSEYPIRLISEIDWDGYEIRKLEFFEDGSVGFACAATSELGVELGTVSVPSIVEINAMEEFESKEISQADFDALWTAVAGQSICTAPAREKQPGASANDRNQTFNAG